MNKPLIIKRLAFLFLFFPIALFCQNATCADALLVGEGEYVIENFSGEGAIFQGATAAVWYKYEPTEKGVFTVSSCGGGGDSRLVLMFLEDCSKSDEFQIINSAEDNCVDGKGGETASTIESVAIPGFSYIIYWDNGQSEDGFSWNLTFTSDTQNQTGSTCETASEIEKGTHEVSELIGTGTAFSDAVSAKWYEFTPEMDGVLAVSSCASAVNTRLFIFEGTCDAPQILAQNDDGCGSSGASVLDDTAIVEKDKPYFIYWDDHNSKEGFTFELNVADIPSILTEPIWAKSIHLYPNPVATQLFIEYDFGQYLDLKISIYNSLGQQLLTENWTSFQKGTVDIAVNHLPKGRYFLAFTTGNERVVRQFVK